jgi:hypothetical protein
MEKKDLTVTITGNGLNKIWNREHFVININRYVFAGSPGQRDQERL